MDMFMSTSFFYIVTAKYIWIPTQKRLTTRWTKCVMFYDYSMRPSLFFFIIMDDRNETKSHKPYMDSFREIKISTISHFSFKSGKHELIDVSLRYLHHISILLLLRELLVKIQFFRQCIAIFFTKQWMDIFYIT